MNLRFNPPPNWPPVPPGWSPPAGWTPDPRLPPLPAGWQLWVEDDVDDAVDLTSPAPLVGPPPRSRTWALALALVAVLGLLVTGVVLGLTHRSDDSTADDVPGPFSDTGMSTSEPLPTEPWPTEPWPGEPWPSEPWPSESSTVSGELWADAVKGPIDDVATDLRDVSSAASAQDLPALVSACTSLRQSVASAQEVAPAPVPGVAAKLDQMFGHYAAAAIACMDGAATQDPAELNDFVTELSAGNRYLDQVNAILSGL